MITISRIVIFQPPVYGLSHAYELKTPISAIHRAAGPELVQACRKVPEVKPEVRCPTGEARITPLVLTVPYLFIFICFITQNDRF